VSPPTGLAFIICERYPGLNHPSKPKPGFHPSTRKPRELGTPGLAGGPVRTWARLVRALRRWRPDDRWPTLTALIFSLTKTEGHPAGPCLFSLAHPTLAGLTCTSPGGGRTSLAQVRKPWETFAVTDASPVGGDTPLDVRGRCLLYVLAHPKRIPCAGWPPNVPVLPPLVPCPSVMR
jgi:hypothetical protein